MKLKDKFGKYSLKGFSGVSFPTLAESQLLKWFENLTKSASNSYDKALDMEYFKSHLGGGDHRLFDGGHDLFGAWKRTQDALPDDSFSQEVIGYVSALWKDVTTAKGLPFATVDKANFDNWVESVSSWNIPGLDRKYLYDLLSFDAMEIISSGFGVFGVLFALKKEDKKKVAEILASMGIVSITSANPIMGVITMGLTFYSYKVKKAELEKQSMIKGGAITMASVFTFALLGLPFLVELIVVVFVSHTLKKHLFSKSEVLEHFKSQISGLGDHLKARAENCRTLFKKNVG